MKPRVAIVCDWLLNRGGAERVIQKLHELFPQAEIFTALYNPEKLPGFEKTVVHTSFLQKIPYAKQKHYFLLPLMPYAFEQFDLSKFDIVISSCHSASKGIITKPRTLHICYCHSPMRYAWDNCHEYIEKYGLPFLAKERAKKLLHTIRMWDRLSADRVDFFLANSEHVRKRIQKYYRRDATVLYPPVETKHFEVAEKTGKYFLAVGRLTPYKRFDLLIQVFNKLRLPLRIVGAGREEKKLRKMAGGTIEFLSDVDDRTLRAIYQDARALLFPQTEDFGITPVEAMSCGRPVIAYAEGGALETIIPGETGIFFNEQRPEAIEKAIHNFQKHTWDPKKIRKAAERFDSDIFAKNLLNFISEKWDYWQKHMV